MALLSVTGIGKSEGNTLAVKDIYFTQEPLQKIAIAGEAGSGKTTLLKMLAGLIQPDAGEILLNNTRVKGPDELLIPGHKDIAYLSQHFELRNNYKVYEVLEMASSVSEEEARDIYKVCRIEHLLHRWTDELSGGEKQRIALARVLGTSPKLLLLDEPFSNLDGVNKKMVQEVLSDISQKIKMSCMMVSHDAADILSWADTILVMKNGEIIQEGPPSKIYYQPANEYCAALFGDYNLVNTNHPAFAAIMDMPPNKSPLMIRPEEIVITTASTKHVEGAVLQIYFRGNYNRVDVWAAGQLIKVQSNNQDLLAGDKVTLCFNGRKHCMG
jgi:ABC-type Fe3+/spermidine/putrescine transport system ATPase subunit